MVDVKGDMNSFLSDKPTAAVGLAGVRAAAAAEALAGWVSGGSSESELEPELDESELPATRPLPTLSLSGSESLRGLSGECRSWK